MKIPTKTKLRTNFPIVTSILLNLALMRNGILIVKKLKVKTK